MSHPGSVATHPDLVLSIQRVQRGSALYLVYNLRSQLKEESPYEQLIDAEPRTYFDTLFGAIEKLSGRTEHRRFPAIRRLEGFGTSLAEKLLPGALRELLWSYHSASRPPQDPAPSLLLLTDEPWVPWELLRLRGTSRHQGESRMEGAFLGEVFALTRWLRGIGQTLRLHLHHIGLVIPRSSDLDEVRSEHRLLHALHESGRCRVTDVPARFRPFMEALGSDQYDGWHFSGHGWAKGENPDLWSLLLEEGDTLTPTDLLHEDCDLTPNRPLVFLNACHSARAGLALTGFSGLAQAFIKAGAGAAIGTYWALVDDKALRFAQLLYEYLFEGYTIAEAVRQSRLALKKEYPGDPTWLAYTTFAHPLARRGDSPVPPGADTATSKSLVMMEGAEAALARIRALSSVAIGDADFVAVHADPAVGEIRLSAGLYVPRELEETILAQLLEQNDGTCLLVVGNAGYGKTSLLWSLHRRLRDRQSDREVLFIKATLLASEGSSLTTTPGQNVAADLKTAARYLSTRATAPILLLDTVDLLLHNELDRDSTLGLVGALREIGSSIVMTCRVQEAQVLQSAIHVQRLSLGEYTDRELAEAIRKHVSRFYERPNRRQVQEHVERLQEAVARGYPLREVCYNPLTLRMLFALYAPHEIHSHEINVFDLYGVFWEDRVVHDRRAGSGGPDHQAPSLEKSAGAVALIMLAEGQPEIGRRLAVKVLARFGGETSEIEDLKARGVLQGSGDSLSFFHQTFMEYSAAQGVLIILGGEGLAEVSARFFKNTDDLFLGPIFAQALLLARDFDLEVRSRARQLKRLLFEDQTIPAWLSSVFVYIHEKDTDLLQGEQVRETLRSGNETAVGMFLDMAPSMPIARSATLFEELEIIWDRQNWGEQEKILYLLERLAARRPEQVKVFIAQKAIPALIVDRCLDCNAVASFVPVLSPLASHDADWVWSQLVELFRWTHDAHGLRPFQADIIEVVVKHADRFDSCSVATRFTAETGLSGTQSNVPASILRAGGRLWAAEWRGRRASLGECLEDCRNARAMTRRLVFRGLAELLLAARREEVLHVLTALAGLRSPAARFEWASVGLTVLLFPRDELGGDREAEPPGSVSARAIVAEQLASAIRSRRLAAEDSHKGKSGQIQYWVYGIRAASLPHRVLGEMLSGTTFQEPEVWLDVNLLGTLLLSAAAGGHTGARAALARFTATPEAYGEDLARITVGQLASSEDLWRWLPSEVLAYCIRVKSSSAILTFFSAAPPAPPPRLSLESQTDLRSLISGLANSRKGRERRQAYEIWNYALRLDLLPCPDLEELVRRMEEEKFVAARSQLAALLASISVRAGYPLPRVLEVLTSTGPTATDEPKREVALRCLMEAINNSSVSEKHVDVLTRVALIEPVKPRRVALLGGTLIKMCATTPDRVLLLLEEILSSDAVRKLSSRGRQNVVGDLKILAREAFRNVSREVGEGVLDRLPKLDPDLAMLFVDAARMSAFWRLRSAFDRLSRDERLSDTLKVKIHQHRSEEDHFGGHRWPELYGLVEELRIRP